MVTRILSSNALKDQLHFSYLSYPSSSHGETLPLTLSTPSYT